MKEDRTQKREQKRALKKERRAARKVMKPRYKFFMWLTHVLTAPIIKFKYHAKINKFDGRDGRNYLILFNHQTPFDQFFIGAAFRSLKKTIRLVATEDVTSNGFFSRFLTFAYGIIPFKKQTTDVKAVAECMKTAECGGNIAIAPEGNRTYSGETCYIRPSIAGLIKALKLPVLFFTIDGGYGVEPRWSSKRRKGKMTCGVTRVLEYEEYKNLSKDEVYDIVKNELNHDESSDGRVYKSRRSAEKLERLIYVCPHCGLSEFTSRKDTLTCKSCGRSVKYNADKTFSGDFGFKTGLEWYKYQEEYIKSADLSAYTDTPAFTDTVRLSRVIPYVIKVPVYKKAHLSLYADRIVFKSRKGEKTFEYKDVKGMTVLGRNKLNVITDGTTYQIKGSKAFNAVKYMHFYYVFAQKEGVSDGSIFFGI